MSTHWQRVSATEWRLDDVWTVRLRDSRWWQAYRDGRECLARFPLASDAMDEAKRLRKEDEGCR